MLSLRNVHALHEHILGPKRLSITADRRRTEGVILLRSNRSCELYAAQPVARCELKLFSPFYVGKRLVSAARTISKDSIYSDVGCTGHSDVENDAADEDCL